MSAFSPELQTAMHKVVQVMGLLGSDHDPEVISAARAIRRILQAHDMTFADFKAALTASIDPSFRFVNLDDSPERIRMRGYLEELLAQIEFMKDYEIRFVRQMTVQYGNNNMFAMTERQANWFFTLYARYVV